MTHRLIYVSAARRAVDSSDLDAILETSRRNNARDGITGVLIYHDLTFVQMLEGDADAVHDCYARIEGDSRHGEIARIIDDPIATRAFPNWSMGFAAPANLDAPAREGVHSLAALRRTGFAGLADDPVMTRLLETIVSGLRH